MALNKSEFIYFTQDKDGGKFEFRYEGIPKNNNIDTYKKVQELITKFMKQIKYHDNMTTNVRFLRTILKDYDEKLLVLNYKNDYIEETIKFDNSHMFLFEKKEKDIGSEFSESFTIQY